MNQIPSLTDFLNEVDKDNILDKEKAKEEISMVCVLQAVSDAKSQLTPEQQEELSIILNNPQYLDIEAIYELFKRDGREAKFIDSLINCIGKVKMGYIRAQLEALPNDKREAIISKFPALKEAIS